MDDYPSTTGAGQLSDADFSRLSNLIQTRLGIKMPPSKKAVIQSRLLRRMRIRGHGSFHAYCDFLFSPEGVEDELPDFLDVATTNKTNFFRESQHFDILAKDILPAMVASGQRTVKIWSAGCSTGEEPYTLAMVLSEYAAESRIDFSILATDVSTRVLRRAQSAVYTEEDIEPIPLVLRKKYLLRSRDKGRALVKIAPELRAKVRFGKVNFMAESFPIRDTFDVIMCRNVIIYFDKETQEKLMNKFCRHLRRDGYLFVGMAESLNGLTAPIRFFGKSIYQRT